MYTPHPPRPSYPPRPGAAPQESDESLAAQAAGRAQGDAARPLALLLARHWQPTYDYAAICLGTSGHAASMAAAATFRQVLERLRQRDAGDALRPRLLVAVRETVTAWSGDDHVSGLLPELRKSAGARGMRAAAQADASHRALAERSFQALPGSAQCLLWHTEVEAEPISVPAGLLAMDTGSATATLEQAREQFRAGCVRAHRDLAPAAECRFYNRLLDIPIRRGGALLPDVREHVLECRYCRHAAEQLALCTTGLGVLLSEAVLGWGARRYLESRPGRGTRGARPGLVPGQAGRRPEGGRHRLLSRTNAPDVRRTPSRMPSMSVIAGAGLASAAVLSAVLVTTLSSDEGRGAGPAASPGATGSQASPPAVPPPATSAGFPGVFGHARLRNAGTDLCLDVRGGDARSGAGTTMSGCSAGKNQQWSYGTDGLLRSLADPQLCLDSRADDGAVTLARCVGAKAADFRGLRYDLTVQGQLLPQRREGLAVVPASPEKGADVVVKIRDGSVEQKWVLDASTAAPESRPDTGTGAPSAKSASDVPPERAREKAEPWERKAG
ncbi:RICIN domain-containing protein [Streptomyces chryseus]|uniref:Hydrolase n=2 Tax=Streptomyces chryseus TaxID=68186 RepID=A0ABQ3DN09_9ACTN|nr:ricin-type beta-trefoil lectin domain protein [Streptomyces chryseus]GHA96303.1 hydrolase [Streptomyces chryseus]